MLKLDVHRPEADGSALLGLIDICRDHLEPQTWYRGLLLLHPDARTRGAKHAIAEGLADMARSAGALRPMLSVVEENAAALRFWRAVGFASTRRLRPRRFGAKQHARIEFARTLL